MHKYKLPRSVLSGWLGDSLKTTKGYGHLLLEQTKSPAGIAEDLRPYFESAHLDAREYIHKAIRIDLHPDAKKAGANATYPNCLPGITLRGLFGEVMSGVLTEHYQYVGKHKWEVPVFLFRYHTDAKDYLFKLARDTKQTRQVIGRPGSDFLALAFNEDGSIKRYLVGEAKWRKTLSKGVFNTLLNGSKNKKGIWHQLNVRDKNIPPGMQDLQTLLIELGSDKYEKAILSIDEALLVRKPKKIPRTNLILIAGVDFSTRSKGQSVVDQKVKPAEYSAKHDLQIVELFLAANGDALIEEIYSSLWKGVRP
ncbi:TPA: hypothetical protein RQO46_005005 [Klebsiella oxytoca]|uniref:hypothetical protein n=1 Tax=Kluyvera intermedia TaxID=61648 RepID=UPI002892976B|nr:hypothetical protein [Klebsiella oxytoca]